MTPQPTPRITDGAPLLVARRRALARKEAPLVRELAQVAAKARHKPELPRDKAWWALSAGAVPACMAGLPWFWSPDGSKLPVLLGALAMAALLAWVQRSWHACAVASQHQPETPMAPQTGPILLCSLVGAACAVAGVGGLREGLENPIPVVTAALAGVLLTNLGLKLLWHPLASFSQSLRIWAAACLRHEQLQTDLERLRRAQDALSRDLEHLEQQGAGVHALLQAPMSPQTYAQAQRLAWPRNPQTTTPAPALEAPLTLDPELAQEGPSTLDAPGDARLPVTH